MYVYTSKKQNRMSTQPIHFHRIMNNKSPESTQLTESIEEETIDVHPREDEVWSKKSVIRAWLLLCFTTGPVASMSRTYVPAAIQSLVVTIGKSADGGKCLPKGNDCYVKFGTGWVHATSYVLFVKAIYTAL